MINWMKVWLVAQLLIMIFEYATLQGKLSAQEAWRTGRISEAILFFKSSGRVQVSSTVLLSHQFDTGLIIAHAYESIL